MVALRGGTLRDAPFSDDPVKGGRVDLTSRWSLGAGATYQSFFAAPTAPACSPDRLLAVDLPLRNFLRRDWVLGLDLAAGATDGSSPVGTPFRFSELSLATSLMVEWPGRS